PADPSLPVVTYRSFHNDAGLTVGAGLDPVHHGSGNRQASVVTRIEWGPFVLRVGCVSFGRSMGQQSVTWTADHVVRAARRDLADPDVLRGFQQTHAPPPGDVELNRTFGRSVATAASGEFTRCGVVPSRNAFTIRTTSAAMACCACWVEAPMWCVPYVFGCCASAEWIDPVLVPSSSANTSTPARIPLESIMSVSACSSISSARAVLRMIAPGVSSSSRLR